MHIIPEPRVYLRHSGEFLIKYNTEIVMQENMSNHCFASVKLLQKEVKELLGHQLQIKKVMRERPETNQIVLSYPADAMGEEEYSLDVDSERIRITARTDRGFLYGLSSLMQLIRIHKNQLQGMHIRDWPAFANRGFLLDVSRGRIPGMAYLKSLIDHLAFYKINQLQLYVESCVRLEGLEEIWSKTEAITPEEIMEIDEYCARRGIELVPCLATFGHLYDMLRTESFSKYAELGVDVAEPFTWYHRMRYHIVNVSDEGVFQLILGLLEQYLPLFRSKKVNICCDETFDLGKGKSAARAEQEGYAKLYYSYVNKLAACLEKMGREVMLWADIIHNHPLEIGTLNRDVVCLNWNYSPDAKEADVKVLAEHGYKQYVCPTVSGYSRIVNAYDMSFANIRQMSILGEKYRVDGFLNTDWGDCGHINMPALSVPGMIYGAAMSWNPRDRRCVEQIDESISVVEYGDAGRTVMKELRRLSRQDLVIFNEISFFRDYKMYGLKYPSGDSTLYDRAEKIIRDTEAERLNNAIAKCEEILNRLPCYQKKTTIGEREMEEFLLSARGVRLFQMFSLILKKYEYRQEITVEITPAALAAKLEAWIVDYGCVWRKSSRESELVRITDFTADLCKILRRYKPG